MEIISTFFSIPRKDNIAKININVLFDNSFLIRTMHTIGAGMFGVGDFLLETRIGSKGLDHLGPGLGDLGRIMGST